MFKYEQNFNKMAELSEFSLFFIKSTLILALIFFLGHIIVFTTITTFFS